VTESVKLSPVTQPEAISVATIGQYVNVRHRSSGIQMTGILVDVTATRFALRFRIGTQDHEHWQSLSDWEPIPKRTPQKGDLIVGDMIRLGFSLDQGSDDVMLPMYYDEGWTFAGTGRRADSTVPAAMRLASNAVYLDQHGIAIPREQVELDPR